MPLVKLIGAQPTTAAAAAAAMEAANANMLTDDIPAEAAKRPQLPVVQSDEPEEIQFFGKVPLWKDDTPEGVLAMRKMHTDYIVEVHLHALGFLVVALTQWSLIFKIEALVDFAQLHYHFALVPFVMSFVMLISLIFFYDFITKGRSIAVFYMYTTVMLEFSSVPIALPICESNLTKLLSSGFISTIVIIIGIIIAHSKRDFYIYKPEFILTWTCRIFLIASVGINVGLSLPSPYFDVVMTMTMLFFMSLYIFMCARAISSAEFVWMDKYGPHMYGALFFINYMTLFAMNVLLLAELEQAYAIE